MEEIQKKKGNTGLIVTVIILIILLLGSIGYICYDKGIFNSLLGKDESVEKPKQEDLINESIFKLSDINCTGTDVCEKSVKLSYNNANHDVKLVKKLANSTKYSIEVYIDNQLVDTLDGGKFNSWNDTETATDWLEYLDGYIYVIDSKYLGIVYRFENNKPSWFLKFYNNAKPFESEKKILVANNYSPLIQNGKTLTDLDALEFDGVYLKYWHWYCDDKDIDTEEGYIPAQQHSVTFDGSRITNNIVKTIRDAIGGGQHTCDDD